MSVENKLKSMLCELDNYRHNKKDLMENYIQDRLTKALKVYYNNMKQTYLYLEYRNEKNLLSKYKRTL